MVIYKGRAITLKHFLMSPVIAAGAGYDFNIGDVISFQVNSWLKLMGDVYEWFFNLPDCQIKELTIEIFKLFVLLSVICMYPVFFLPLAAGAYVGLKKTKNLNVTDYDILKLCNIVEKL